MRQARLKAPPGHGAAYYHCLSRVVDRQFVFDDEAKEHFVKLMRKWERFSGVRVLTYCVLSNHFHLLVEVSPRPAQLPSIDELFSLLEATYSPGVVLSLRQQWEAIAPSSGGIHGNLIGGSGSSAGGGGGNTESAPDPAASAAWQEQFFGRMWDVSAFMKALKQQFTQWHNRRHQRKGTLWEERFKSVLVEGAGLALSTMAAYIDLNPLRAGLAEDPKDYRWSGYGAAVAGSSLAREGLATVVAGMRRPNAESSPVLAEYRLKLYGDGEQRGVSEPARGIIVRRGLSPEEVQRVVAAKGRLGTAEMLRCRVRYFADGAVLGSKAFVESVFQAQRQRFGPKRQTGARPLRHLPLEDLRVLRALRLRVLG